MTKRAAITILDAIADPKLFAPWFKDRKTWAAWFAFLAGAVRPAHDGRAVRDLSAVHRPHRAHRARPSPRRGSSAAAAPAKSFMLALIAVFLACFYDYRKHLAPGERGTIMVVAADRKQARTIMRYVRGFLTNVPMLARMIEREAAESFDLDNGVTIEVGTVSFRSTRGYTIVAGAARRAGVLADRRRRRQSRQRGHRRDPARHGDDPERHAAVCVVALRAPRCLVGRLSPALRPGRRSGSGLAGADPHHEPDGAAIGR